MGGGQRAPSRGSQSGYLAPGSPGSASGSGSGQANYGGGSSSGDYDEIIPADVGYGAPNGQDGFEGAGDFPLLNEYTRNTRDSSLDDNDDDEEEVMNKTA